MRQIINVKATDTFILEVTNRCNLNCEYCMQKLRNNKTNTDLDEELWVPSIDEFFEDNPNIEYANIHFFGGEPTLKKEKILTTLNELKKKKYWNKIRPCLTTNCLLFFPEWFDFMKENNKEFFFSMSYDGVGQLERTKNEKIINKIEENIKKYNEIALKNNFRILHNFTLHLCLTEENVDTLYDSFMKITYELGLRLFDFVPVFPEYWKEESFSKLTKQMEKIYNHVLESMEKNKFSKVNIPHITLSGKYDSEKYNRILSSDYRAVLKIPATVIKPDGQMLKDRVNRGNTKKHYKYKIIPISLEGERKYHFDDIEMELLSNNSSNRDEFVRMTRMMIMGASEKQWKFNIMQIFNFNHFFIKKWIRRVKILREANKFDAYQIFKNNGVDRYLSMFLDKKTLKEIFDIFNENFLDVKIEKDIATINGTRYKIMCAELNNGILGKNNNDGIIVDKHQHMNKNIYETIHHEVMHLYLKQFGINKILMENKIQHIEELLCEIYVNHMLSYNI